MVRLKRSFTAAIYFLLVFLTFFYLFSPGSKSAAAEGIQEKKLTLMIYMCGSDLESLRGAATADIEEVLKSDFNTNEANIILMAGGSAHWHNSSVPQDNTTIIAKFEKPGKNHTLINVWPNAAKNEEAALLNMGDPDTLTFFLRYCLENYPAQEYALILWDHGMGPLGGICADELFDLDSLSLIELSDALKNASLPKKLSWIGFDACLMSSAEVAFSMEPYADYMIASQNVEPATGWNYDFLNGIELDRDAWMTAQRIVKAYFDGENKDKHGLTLSCLDLSKISDLRKKMDKYFSAAGRSLDEAAFSALSSELHVSAVNFGKAVISDKGTNYDLIDLGDLLRHFEHTEDTEQLQQAINSAVLVNRGSEGLASGLSVYHPLLNLKDYHDSWGSEYERINTSSGYKNYLNAFGSILMGNNLADWSNLHLSDVSVPKSDNHRFSLQLTAEQQQYFASAQLMIFGAVQNPLDGEIDGEENADTTPPGKGEIPYYPIWVGETKVDENGVITAEYSNRSLYLLNENEDPIAGPISYALSENGRYVNVFFDYFDFSGKENYTPAVNVMYSCTEDPESGQLTIITAEVYDQVTKTYTGRLGFNEENYTTMYVDRLTRKLPDSDGVLPKFDTWEGTSEWHEVLLPQKWHLKFLDEQLSGTPLYAAIQVTDVQNYSVMTPLVRVQNPNLNYIDIFPRTISGDGFELTLYAMLDNSKINPGLTIAAEVLNTSDLNISASGSSFTINGTRKADSTGYWNLRFSDIKTGETGYDACRIDISSLTGLREIREISFTMEDFPVRGEDLPISFSLSGCDLSSLDPKPVRSLAESEKDGIFWELISLERNVRGGLDCLIHITNRTDSGFYHPCSIALNNAVQTDTLFYFNVPAHQDVYEHIEFTDSIVLSSLIQAYRSQNRRFLGTYQLAEKFGIQNIEDIMLSFLMYDKEPYIIRFGLSPVYPFASPEQASQSRDFSETDGSHILLNRELNITTDRVFIGYTGMGFRIKAENLTDHIIELEIGNLTINGEKSNTSSKKSIQLAPRTSCISLVEVRTDFYNTISDIGFTVRYDDFTSHKAYIRLNTPAETETADGIYLSPDAFIVEPAIFDKPDGIITSPAPYSAANSEFQLSFRISNTVSAPEDQDTDLNSYEAVFQINNLSNQRMKYRFGNFILNGNRLVSTESGSTYIHIEPGAKGKTAVKISREQLTNIGEISSLGCDVTVEIDGDPPASAIYPLQFEVQNCDLSGINPVYTHPAAETTVDDVTWQLLELDCSDSDGSIKGIFRIYNGSETTIRHSSICALLDGIGSDVSNYFVDMDAEQPPGTEIYAVLRYPNEAAIEGYGFTINGTWYFNTPYEGQMLQANGINAVRNVDLLIDKNVYSRTIKDIIHLELSEPLLLPSRNEYEYKNLQDELTLLDGDVAIGISYLLVGDNGIAAALSMRNNTSSPQMIELLDPFANAVPLEINSYRSEFLLAPDSVTMRTITLLFPDDTEYGTPLKTIRLSFCVDGERYENALIQADIPINAGFDERIGSTHLYVKQAIKNGETEYRFDPDLALIPENDPVKVSLSFFPVIYDHRSETWYKAEINNYSGVNALNEDETFEAALKITNNETASISPQISAFVNGSLFTWDKTAIESGKSRIINTLYAAPKDGSYDVVYFIDGHKAFSGTIQTEDGKLTAFSGEPSEGFNNEKQLNDESDLISEIDPSMLSCSIVIGRRNLETNEWTEETSGHYYPIFLRRKEDHDLAETYEPALKIINHSPETIAPNVSAWIDGRLFTWDPSYIESGDSYYYYTAGADLLHYEGRQITFLIDDTEVCSDSFKSETLSNLYYTDSVSVGDSVFLGMYQFHDFPADWQVPIEWIVLDVHDGKALLLSKYALDSRAFNEAGKAAAWDSSSLRTWLNRDFYGSAFQEYEMVNILITDLNPEQNPEHDTKPGKKTRDRLFPLSISEAEKYRDVLGGLACEGTEYSISQGLYEFSNGNCWWWLRTQGEDPESTVSIDPFGDFEYYGEYNDITLVGVRPAMWVDISWINGG